MSGGLTVGLVGCGCAKLPYPAPAKDLYVGGYFKLASALVRRLSDQWAIVSAKHGVLDPDQKVAPYYVTLCKSGVAAAGKTGSTLLEGEARRRWEADVQREIMRRWPVRKLVVVLSEEYMGCLRDLPYERLVPSGLRIGEQMAWIKRELDRLGPQGRLL